MYLSDANNHFNTSEFVDNKVLPELKELVNKYKPQYIWSDGDWNASPDYWKSKEFLAWLYNESPVKDTVIVNDRWGDGARKHHGDVFNGGDNYHPPEVIPHPWESAQTTYLDSTKAWKFMPEAKLEEYKSDQEIVHQLVRTVSFGGNFLLNVGPNKDGTIPALSEERLMAAGNFLRINGEAIYGCSAWKHQNDSHNEKVW